MASWGRGGVFDLEVLEQRAGILVARVSGKNVEEIFKDEPGGHRWQRVPPTEKRGRVQTSTVTVAVLREPEAVELRIDERDLEIKTCRGSGAGGQHRNVTDSAVQIFHKPSGLMVRAETERSQSQNREYAMGLLRARLLAAAKEAKSNARAADRRSQVGSGMRGDKRRTIRCQDGQVNDHISGRTWKLKEYMRGDW